MRASRRVFSILAVALMVVGAVPTAMATPPTPAAVIPNSRTPERGVGILETCDASRKDDPVSHRRAIIEMVAGASAHLLLLPRVLVAGYARIWGDALIENPRRRHLVQLVRETPGIHTRELQRRCGLQWGVFSGHLHVLVRAGHLTLVRDGRYRRVHARGGLSVGMAWVPHAIPRCLLALLRDGPLPANACRERLGVTRQRLDHHIARLVDAGLVRVALDPASGTRVMELSPGATREAPEASGGLQPPRRA